MGSPFRGLEPFGFKHAPVFAGREDDIEQAIAALTNLESGRLPFLLMVGASGSGKSSLARCGIASRLTTAGVVSDIDIWRIAVMRPSEHKNGAIFSLSQSLFVSEADLHGEDEGRPPALPELRDSDFSTAPLLAGLLATGDSSSATPISLALRKLETAVCDAENYGRDTTAKLLLVIDQLDELFASDTDSETRGNFVKVVRTLLDSGDVWVIATLRSDLYSQLLQDSLLIDLKKQGVTIDVRPPAQSEIADIVRKPAAAAGLKYQRHPESGRTLDSTLLADADKTDMLPLLQFTLNRLFDERVDNQLTFEAYKQLGGLSGAVDAEAERAYHSVSPEAQNALPSVFRQLVGLSADMLGEKSNALTTRMVDWELLASTEADEELLRALIDARILQSSGDGNSRRVHLAHERVLFSWQRAAKILEESRDFLRIREDISTQFERYNAAGTNARDFLIPKGLPLAEAVDIREAFANELSSDLKSFIDQSARKASLRQRLVAAAAVVFAFIAVLAAWQFQRAEESREEATQSLQAAQNSRANLLGDLARQALNDGRLGDALALAIESVPADIESRDNVAVAENALFAAVHQYSTATVRPKATLRGHSGTVRGARYSSDGSHIVTWSFDGTACAWTSDGQKVGTLRHDSVVLGAVIAPTNDLVASWSLDDTIAFARLDAPEFVTSIVRHDSTVHGAVFTASGDRLVSWSRDNTIRIWDTSNASEVARLVHEDFVISAALIPGTDDDPVLLSWSNDGTARTWNIGSGEELVRFRHDAAVSDTRFHADNTQVLTWSKDHTARLWDIETGDLITSYQTGGEVVRAAIFADDNALSTRSRDGSFCLFALDSGEQRFCLQEDYMFVGADLSFEAGLIATASNDGDVRVWSLADGSEIADFRHLGLLGVRLSPDNKKMLSWSDRATARIWDIENKREASHIDIRHDDAIRWAGYGGNGYWLWTYSDDGKIALWQARDGTRNLSLGHKANVLGFVLSPSGEAILSWSADSTARIWALNQSDTITIDGTDDGVVGAQVASNGQLGIAWKDSQLHAFRLLDGSSIATYDASAEIVDAFLLDSGENVLVRTATGDLIHWQPNVPGQEQLMLNDESLTDVRILPDGRHALTVNDMSLAQLWDLSNLQVAASHQFDAAVVQIEYSADLSRFTALLVDGRLVNSDGQLVAVIDDPVPENSSFVLDVSHDRLVLIDGSEISGVWSVSSRQKLFEIRHEDAVTGARLSPDGRRILSWGKDNYARLWDAGTGERLLALAHNLRANGVSGGTFTQRGDQILTWGSGAGARVWDAQSGTLRIRANTSTETAAAEFLADERRFVTHSSNGSLDFWDTTRGDLLASYPNAGRNDDSILLDDESGLLLLSETSAARFMPLWPDYQGLRQRAVTLAEEISSLSDVEACRSFIKSDNCFLIAGKQEKDLALENDAQAVQILKAGREVGTMIDLVVGVDENNHLDIEFATNARGKVVFFHNRDFRKDIQSFVLDTLTQKVYMKTSDGYVRDTGLALGKAVTWYMAVADQVLMVKLDDETGEATEGRTVPLLHF